MFERLVKEGADISGHALMITAPSMNDLVKYPGNYNELPNMPAVDLNVLLANSTQFNRAGEVTPVMAVQMISNDERYSLLTLRDFQNLQAKLKARSRCYG